MTEAVSLACGGAAASTAPKLRTDEGIEAFLTAAPPGRPGLPRP